MSNLNHTPVNGDLNEELKTLGLELSSPLLLGESAKMISPVQPIGGQRGGESAGDLFDGPVVTRELLQRVSNLPFETMEDGEIDDLMNALKEKALPAGDPELAEIAETVMMEVFQIIRSAKGKRRKIKRTIGAEKSKGKRYRKKMRSAIRRSKKKYARSGAGKRFKRAMKRRKARLGESANLYNELVALVEGGNEDSFGPQHEIVNRIGNVFGLLEVLLGEDEVGEVLGEAYELMCSSLDESDDDADFLDKVTAPLNVINRCLKAVDELEDIGEEDFPN